MFSGQSSPVRSGEFAALKRMLVLVALESIKAKKPVLLLLVSTPIRHDSNRSPWPVPSKSFSSFNPISTPAERNQSCETELIAQLRALRLCMLGRRIS